MVLFDFQSFEALSSAGRQSRARELAVYLSERLREADDFDDEVGRLIGSLRSQGHDLWSWDESDDFQLWGPDYQNRDVIRGLVIHFAHPWKVDVEWKEGGDPSTARQVFGEGL